MGNLARLSLGIMILSGPVLAVERYGYTGVSVGTAIEVEPEGRGGDETYSIDFATFFSEWFAWALSFDVGLSGAQRVGLGVGPQIFFLLDSAVKPYVISEFLYTFDPSSDVGWRAGAGLEWDMVALTGINNIRLYAETGASGYYLSGAPNIYQIDLIGAGFLWTY